MHLGRKASVPLTSRVDQRCAMLCLPLRPSRGAKPNAVAMLATICLLCAWLAAIVLVETAGTGQNWDKRPILVPQRNPLYYCLHGLGILAAIGSGIIGGLSGRRPRLPVLTATAFFVLCGTAVTWALIAYSPKELLSIKILGMNGPFVWLTVVLFFAGMHSSVWLYIDSTLRFITFATAVLAIRAIATQPSYVHFAGFSKTLQYVIVLAWCGGWTVLNGVTMRGFRRWIALAPLPVLALTAIYAQGRSWTIMAALIGTLFILGAPVLGRFHRGHGIPLLGAVLLACCCCLLIVWTADRLMPDAFNIFQQRLYEDTRTNQYVAFFADVRWQELVLGRGPTGAWYWPGVGYFEFIDNCYLGILLKGGLPILLGYCIVVLLPAGRVLCSNAPPPVAVSAWMLALWALSLGGLGTYSGPGLNFQSYLMCLLAGRCLEWLGKRGTRYCPRGPGRTHSPRTCNPWALPLDLSDKSPTSSRSM